MKSKGCEMTTKLRENTVEIQPATIDGATLTVVPIPTIHLKTADDIRLEMARVYREMRTARIAMEDGTKLVYVLGQLCRIIEVSEVQKRIEAVERVLSRRN
jgi:hypothetical protein